MQLWKNKHWPVGVFIGAWTVYFALFWRKALFFDEAGNVVAGHVNIWGDWAAHLTMATAFAQRGWLTTSPIVVGEPFRYPFLINAISGLLHAGGIPLTQAMIIPSFVLSIFAVCTLVWFYKQLFQKQTTALLATILWLFSGGSGLFYKIFEKLPEGFPAVLQLFIKPTTEATRIDDLGIKWINVIDSMFIPQRAFILGFPMALIGLGLIYKQWHQKNTNWFQILLACGVLGILPIAHTHSFLAVFIILASWAIGAVITTLVETKPDNYLQKLRPVFSFWLSIASITSIIALPALSFIGGEQGITMSWHPGWLMNDYDLNFIDFWWRNWSIVPLLAVLGWVIFTRYKPKQTNRFFTFIPFFLLFILANLISLQPFVWDNTKIFAWSALGFYGLIAWLAHFLWQYTDYQFMKPLITITLIAISASGAYDVYRILRHDLHSYQFINTEEVGLAEWAKTNTEPDSIWLTGDHHNHWLFTWAGRQPVMAYRGWLWTHDYDYKEQEETVIKFYPNPKQHLSDIEKWGIDYIVVGNHERRDWRANQTALENIFSVVHQTETYTIFSTEQEVGQ